MWREINRLVSDPIKRAIFEWHHDLNVAIDITNADHLFSIAQVILPVCDYALQRFVSSWNNHSVSGKYIYYSSISLGVPELAWWSGPWEIISVINIVSFIR